jgi:hypothetical protein
MFLLNMALWQSRLVVPSVGQHIVLLWHASGLQLAILRHVKNAMKLGLWQVLSLFLNFGNAPFHKFHCYLANLY